jgi:hypothetical protein
VALEGDQTINLLRERNRMGVGPSLLALTLIAGVPARAPCADDKESMREIHAINLEWQQAILNAVQAQTRAKSAIDLHRLQKQFAVDSHRFVVRSMELANRQPASVAALIALKLVACRSPETEEGKQAARAFLKQAAIADLGVLAKALAVEANVSENPIDPLIPMILKRVKKEAGHPQAAKLLASVVGGSVDRGVVRGS